MRKRLSFSAQKSGVIASRLSQSMSSLKANPVPYPSAGPPRYIHELQTCSPRRFVCPSDLTDRLDAIASIREIKTDSNYLIAHYATKQVNGQPAFTEVAEEAAGARAQTDVSGRGDYLPWAAAMLAEHGDTLRGSLQAILGPADKRSLRFHVWLCPN
jgi:hypothetical protein